MCGPLRCSVEDIQVCRYVKADLRDEICEFNEKVKI